jgi:hypothetical protein
MRKKWFSVLGDEFQDSEEDQDSMKVVFTILTRFLTTCG